MDDFFYDKEISVYTYGSEKDTNGVNRKKWIKEVFEDQPLLVDLQPYSYEKAKKDYGYAVECTKRIFMDILDTVTENSAIKYNNKYYKVQQLIYWDDYMVVLCLERDDIVIE